MDKRSFRISVTDVLLLSFLLLLAVVVTQKLLLNKQLTMPEQQMTLTIVSENERDFLAESIQVGDAIFQKGASQPFGVITNVEIKPAKVWVNDAQGNTHIRHFEGRKDTHITIEARGFVSIEGSSIIDNSFFHVNQYLPVYTKHTTFATRVVEIR